MDCPYLALTYKLPQFQFLTLKKLNSLQNFTIALFTAETLKRRYEIIFYDEIFITFYLLHLFFLLSDEKLS